MSRLACEIGSNRSTQTKGKESGRKRTKRYACLSATFLIFCLFSISISLGIPVSASPTVSLSINKRLGFAMFSDIAGTFTLEASVSSDVVRVEFYLDSQLELNDTNPPFQWDFDTAEYSLGLHTFKAIAYSSQGDTANASASANFVQSPMPPYYAAFLALTMGSVVAIALIAGVLSQVRKGGKGNRPISMGMLIPTGPQRLVEMTAKRL